MRRTKRILADDQWERIAPLLPEHRASPKGGRPWADDRKCLEGILWLLRTGSGWRDMPPGTPVVADKGHDADELRDEMEEAGYTPVIPHRKNRVKPSRNDGRRLRRYRHRWLVERTNAWLHCYRGLAVRWAYYSFMYVGLAYLSFIHIALQRF